MNCSIQGCPGHYEHRLIVHTVKRGETVLIFENVPAEVCGVCSDILLAPEIIRHLEKLTRATCGADKARASVCLRISFSRIFEQWYARHFPYEKAHYSVASNRKRQTYLGYPTTRGSIWRPAIKVAQEKQPGVRVGRICMRISLV